MKVLSSWLHEFLDAAVPSEAISAAFDDLGTPVEEETRLNANLDGVVVAEVLDLRPHPNADKIQLVDVEIVHDEVVGKRERSGGDQGREVRV